MFMQVLKLNETLDHTSGMMKVVAQFEMKKKINTPLIYRIFFIFELNQIIQT